MGHLQIHATPEFVLEESPLVTYVCQNDEFYTMRYISPGLKVLMGYSPDEFIDNRKHFAASAVLPDDLDVVDEFAELASQREEPVLSRYRLIRADGEVFQALMISRAIRSRAGEVIGFAGCVIDLTNVPALQGESMILSRR